MSSALLSALLTSIVLHSAGLTALAVVSNSLWTPLPPVNIIPAELMVTPPPPAPVESVPPPEVAEVDSPQPPAPEESAPPTAPAALPPPVTPPKPEKIMPPRLVEKMPTKPVKLPVPKVKTPVPPGLRTRLPEPLRTAQNNDKPPRARPSEPSRSTHSNDKLQPGPSLPLPTDDRTAAGNVPGPPSARLTDIPALPAAEGAEAGAGKLFERGDAGVVPGTGDGGGGGGSGRSGLGTGGAGAGGKQGTGLQPGTGGTGSGGGDGPLARPLGGYQVKPRYPESARRQGIAGTTLLKIHVSDRGLVEDVLVERSAGHQELDLAATEAVKKWRFEPAKQGSQPIAVWVMVPIRFELR